MCADGQLLDDYARRGDVSALEALVRRHEKWLLAFIRGLLPDDDAVADAFQETWLRVIRACRGYRGGSVKAYLARTARSVVIDRFRRVRPTVSIDAPSGSESCWVEQLPDSANPPDEAFELRASQEEVRAAVRALPDGLRDVFLLRVEGALAFREIAAELGIPLGTALTWMRTATEKLRKRIGAGHD